MQFGSRSQSRGCITTNRATLDVDHPNAVVSRVMLESDRTNLPDVLPGVADLERDPFSSESFSRPPARSFFIPWVALRSTHGYINPLLCS
jgi:hypothetical protein